MDLLDIEGLAVKAKHIILGSKQVVFLKVVYKVSFKCYIVILWNWEHWGSGSIDQNVTFDIIVFRLSSFIEVYYSVYSIDGVCSWGTHPDGNEWSSFILLPSPRSTLGGKFTPAATSGCISFSTGAPLFDSSGSGRSPCEKTASTGPYGANAGAL